MKYYSSAYEDLVTETVTGIIYDWKKQKKLSNAEFQKMKLQRISFSDFHQMKNKYFREKKATWTFNGEKFAKMPNFFIEDGVVNLMGAQIHEIEGYKGIPCYFVYNCGRLYYMFFGAKSFDKRERVILVDYITRKIVARTSVLNCAPIYNIKRKEVL